MSSPLKDSVAVLVGVALLSFGVVPPTHGGFFCDDPTIGFKYTKDTFKTWLLILLAVAPIFSLMTWCEFRDGDGKVSLAFQRASRAFGHYFVYGGFSLLLNELLKTLVAEPRPHFLDTCQPDWKKVDCEANNGFVRFTPDLCTATNDARNGVPRAIYDAMRSFPSGHAQLSCYAATFAIIYMQKRFHYYESVSTLMKPWIQFGFVTYAAAASITRITDRRHHWWDVLAGSFFGVVTAALAFYYKSHRFVRPKDDAEEVVEMTRSKSNDDKTSITTEEVSSI